MVNYPCECCGYQTISRAGPRPWICATCMRIYKGIWKPGPGQPSREELAVKIEALFKQHEPKAVKAFKEYWNGFEKKLVKIKADRKRRALESFTGLADDDPFSPSPVEWL